MKKPTLGKLLPVGHIFETVTKRMAKDRTNQKMNKDLTGPLVTYEVLRQGDIKTFTKGKRNYVCRVHGISELRTGAYNYTLPMNRLDYRFKVNYRWWQFVYVVEILEN